MSNIKLKNRTNPSLIIFIPQNYRPDYEFLLSSICDYCRCDDGKISIGLFLEVMKTLNYRSIVIDPCKFNSVNLNSFFLLGAAKNRNSLYRSPSYLYDENVGQYETPQSH